MSNTVILFVVETLVRVVVIPFLAMSGGVVIASQAGIAAAPNFALFMAVTSIMGIPWLLKAGVHLISTIMMAQQQAAFMAELEQKMVEAEQKARFNMGGQDLDEDDDAKDTKVH